MEDIKHWPDVKGGREREREERKKVLGTRTSTNPDKGLRAEGTEQPLPWRRVWHLGWMETKEWPVKLDTGYQTKKAKDESTSSPLGAGAWWYSGMWNRTGTNPRKGVGDRQGKRVLGVKKEWSPRTGRGSNVSLSWWKLSCTRSKRGCEMRKVFNGQNPH